MAGLQSTTEEPVSKQRSFAAILSLGQQHHATTSVKEGSCYKGEPAIFFSKEEIQQLSSPLQRALIGKFSRGRPAMDVLRKEFHTIGFKGTFYLGLMDHRHVLIRFDLDEDYHRCWMKAMWTFGKFTMRMLKWTPSFSVDHEPPIVPVWISFEHLPLYLFGKDPLLSVASLLGRPLKIDAATQSLARPSVARICVEVNLLKPLPNRIWIGEDSTGFWQKVQYENLPEYCSQCHKLGHNRTSCKKDQPAPQPQTNSTAPSKIWKPTGQATSAPSTSGLLEKQKSAIPIAQGKSSLQLQAGIAKQIPPQPGVDLSVEFPLVETQPAVEVRPILPPIDTVGLRTDFAHNAITDGLEHDTTIVVPHSAGDDLIAKSMMEDSMGQKTAPELSLQEVVNNDISRAIMAVAPDTDVHSATAESMTNCLEIAADEIATLAYPGQLDEILTDVMAIKNQKENEGASPTILASIEVVPVQQQQAQVENRPTSQLLEGKIKDKSAADKELSPVIPLKVNEITHCYRRLSDEELIARMPDRPWQTAARVVHSTEKKQTSKTESFSQEPQQMLAFKLPEMSRATEMSQTEESMDDQDRSFDQDDFIPVISKKKKARNKKDYSSSVKTMHTRQDSKHPVSSLNS